MTAGQMKAGSFNRINKSVHLDISRYHGIEWNETAVRQAKLKGLDVIQGDLNREMPFAGWTISNVFLDFLY